MPFKSAAQRAWMWANKPRMAKRWSSRYGGKVGGGKTKAQKKGKR